ncbi:MAG: hypothetical protein K8W52_41715 [Deltaproteobacteria bacterium]|nr:hypothetical protein [Deltaproteobacteria bacterium]
MNAANVETKELAERRARMLRNAQAERESAEREAAKVGVLRSVPADPGANEPLTGGERGAPAIEQKVTVVSPTGRITEISPKALGAFERQGFRVATEDELHPAVFMLSSGHDELVGVKYSDVDAFVAEGWTVCRDGVNLFDPSGDFVAGIDPAKAIEYLRQGWRIAK